jgi:hypothetical protein
MSDVVSDAFPLIVLAKAQLLDITPKLFNRVLHWEQAEDAETNCLLLRGRCP